MAGLVDSYKKTSSKCLHRPIETAGIIADLENITRESPLVVTSLIVLPKSIPTTCNFVGRLLPRSLHSYKVPAADHPNRWLFAFIENAENLVYSST